MLQAATRLLLATLPLSPVAPSHSAAQYHPPRRHRPPPRHLPQRRLARHRRPVRHRPLHFHQNLRKDGFFMNAPFDPNGHPQDYNFANASTLKVPGDWNTQRPDLLYYEGPIWYREDFEHTRQAQHPHLSPLRRRQLPHLRLGQHQKSLRARRRLHPLRLRDHRRPQGRQKLRRPLRRQHPHRRRRPHPADRLVELRRPHPRRLPRRSPATNSSTTTTFTSAAPITHLIEGYVHVEGAPAGTTVTVSIPELNAKTQATVDANSRAAISLPTKSLSLWSPENPKLYKVEISSERHLTRQKTRSASAPSKPAARRSSSTASPSSSAASPSTPKLLTAPAAPTRKKTSTPSSAGPKNSAATTSASPTTRTTSA